MDNINISFIIPFFNRYRAVKKAAFSAVSSHRADVEIILVDDGSVEDGIEELKSYCIEYPVIKYIRMDKNSGPGAARNTGIKNAAGKWLYFIDSDDEVITENIEALVYELSRMDTAVDVVYLPNYYILYSDGREEKRAVNIDSTTFMRAEDFLCSSLLRGALRVNSLLLKKEFILKNKIFFENIYYSEDVCYLLPLFYYAAFFGISPLCFYIHHYSAPGSLSSTHGKNKAEKQKAAARALCGAAAVFKAYKNFYAKTNSAALKKRYDVILSVLCFLLLEDGMEEDVFRIICEPETAPARYRFISLWFSALFERIRAVSLDYTRNIYIMPANQAAANFSSLIARLNGGRGAAACFDNLPGGGKAEKARMRGLIVRHINEYNNDGVVLVFGAYMLEIQQQLNAMRLTEDKDYMLCITGDIHEES
ncbi:MAG: glycosyltransferase [Spirochaetaceae bacterium]|jgi:glycosyltransferase involved in cell wall biosynthesis|nr:glycosyltransferase [Spirochaetaceae bacterium]